MPDNRAGIPLWIDQIRGGNPITITDPRMTRFIMSLDEAVDLVLFAFEHGQNGDILVQKAPACTIQTQEYKFLSNAYKI